MANKQKFNFTFRKFNSISVNKYLVFKLAEYTDCMQK